MHIALYMGNLIINKGGKAVNIYVDESGSINKHKSNPYFLVALIHVINRERLKKLYKRFVSANIGRLRALDETKTDGRGKVVRQGGRMFRGNVFKELKGACLDKDMKERFVDFFSRNPDFEVFYIRVENHLLEDHFCEHVSRSFNYIMKLAMEHFIRQGYLPGGPCALHLDERNEKAEARHFLENYLNTELILRNVSSGEFNVHYFDSIHNQFIQIADIFANLYYSELQTAYYTDIFKDLKQRGIIRETFVFPLKEE